MKYFRILLAVILFYSVPVLSQSRDSILDAYNSETIYRFGNKYVKGNTRLSFNDLRKEFTTSHTQGMYQKSKRCLTMSRIFNAASIALIITSVFTKTNISGSIGFAAGTGALGLTGLYFQTESSRYIDRANWERNRDILSGMLHQ
jgi:hypothetical protein